MVLLSHYQNTASQVVHFNYHTRPLSNHDEVFVMDQAAKHGLPCIVIHVPELHDGNFQEQARTYRYNVLSDLAMTQGFEKVLLAHHQDDAIETLLLQLLRGTSLQHLGLQPSLRWNNVLFERPFHHLTKTQLKDYALEHHIEHVEDSSNQTDDYLRNRLRHHIIPLLEIEQPKLGDKVRQLSTQSLLVKEYLNHETEALFLEKSRRQFQDSGALLQDHVLLRWCHAYQIEPHTQLLQLMKRVLLSKEPQSQVQLSPTFWCVVSYDQIAFTTLSESDAFNIEINAPGEYELPNHDIVIISTTKPDSTADYVTLSSEEISFPLHLRTRLSGDSLTMPYGHKSLSDWLMDHKVPNQQRDRMWVLAKANNILWVPSMNYRVTRPASPSLYVQLKERRHETTT